LGNPNILNIENSTLTEPYIQFDIVHGISCHDNG
jgi:hypothetical protein